MPKAKKGFSESLLEYGKIRSFADEAVLSPEAAEPVCSSEPAVAVTLRQAEKYIPQKAKGILQKIFSFSLSHSPFKAIFSEFERSLPCHGLR